MDMKRKIVWDIITLQYGILHGTTIDSGALF